MPKIKPIVHSDDNAFDGIDEMQNTEFHLHRGTKSKKKYKKKQTIRLDGSSSQPKDIVAVVKNMVVGKRSIYIGSPFFVISLLLAMLLTLIPMYQRYNVVVILTIAASVEFKMFPTKSVHAQMGIFLVGFSSIGLDLFQVSTSSMSPLLVATVVFVGFFKALLLNAYLRNSQGAVRTRKYLDRRMRLFYIPLYEPRRIMRDVRGRMLAIGWMHLLAALFYFVLFMLLVLYLDYSVFYLHPTSGGWLPTFLAFKTLSSLVLLFGILCDTDIRLCLWHFGCLGCHIEYIRRYIRRKRIELHGFPLVFAFGKKRFYIYSFFKMLDVGWGMYGWTLVGYSFGAHFMSLDTHLKIFYGLVAFCLVVFDLYVATLLLGVRWLLRRKKVVQAIGELLDSDDSEIEEFGLRTDLQEGIEYQKDKAALVEARRQMYYQRMKKEELRYAEATFNAGQGRGASAGDWVQQYASWAPRRANAIHPGSGEGGEGADVEAADWEDGMVVSLSQSQTHPLMRQLQSNAEMFNHSTKESNKYEAFWDRAAEPRAKKAFEHNSKIKPVSPRKTDRSHGQIASSVEPTAETSNSARNSTLVSNIKKPPMTPPPAESLAAQSVVQDVLLLRRGAVNYSSSDEDLPVRAPPRKQASGKSTFEYETNPLRAARSGADRTSTSTTSSAATFPAKSPSSSKKASTPKIALIKALTLTPEQFAGVWEELEDCSLSTMSTVLVPGPALQAEESGSDNEGKSSGQVALTVRRMQQALLSSIATHLRTQGFSLATAGLHPQRVIKVLFYGTAEQRGHADALPENPALRMGLLEVKLFPGASIPTAQGDQQSYLLEATCRCRNDKLGPTFLALLAFGNIFKMID